MERGKDEIGLLTYTRDKVEEEEAIESYLNSKSKAKSKLMWGSTKIHPYYFAVSAAILVVICSLYSTTTNFYNNSEEYCRWKFDSYEPSAFESSWNQDVKVWQEDVCSKLQEPLHDLASKIIVQRAMELTSIDQSITWEDKDTQPLQDYKKEDDYFSRMYYRRECYRSGIWIRVKGKGVQLIEPLWGMLRDPFDFFCESKHLHLENWIEAGGQSKAHIISQGYSPYAYTDSDESIKDLKWRTHGSPPWINSFEPTTTKELTFWTKPRNVLIDLGSSYFGSWMGGDNAASGSYMYKTFHQRGLKWDKYIAVEVESLSPEEAYKQLPADLVSVYTFMNVPLNVDEGDKLNVISLLRSIANSNDHVVLKLDIDSAAMELPFIYAIRDDPSLSELISELYFEHHVDLVPLRIYWGFNLKEDLADSYNLFTALRHNGIRAHSWP